MGGRLVGRPGEVKLLPDASRLDNPICRAITLMSRGILVVALVSTVAYPGLDARPVEVQCQVAPGMPRFMIVGLPDKAVGESRERVQAALAAMGLSLPPKRITINLSPADLPKEGSHYDLPIALALLAAMGVTDAEQLTDWIAVGELALDGRIVPSPGGGSGRICTPFKWLSRLTRPGAAITGTPLAQRASAPCPAGQISPLSISLACSAASSTPGEGTMRPSSASSPTAIQSVNCSASVTPIAASNASAIGRS